MIRIGQLSCDFVNSLKTQYRGKVQKTGQCQIMDKGNRQHRIRYYDYPCEETGHLLVGKGKGYKGNFAALMVRNGCLSQECEYSTNDGRANFAGTTIQVFTDNEFFEPHLAKSDLGVMASCPLQPMRLSLGNATQDMKWTFGIVKSALFGTSIDAC